MSIKDSFLMRRLKSIGFACNGVVDLIKSEANVQVQICCAIAVTFAIVYFNISKTEWLLQTICIGLVLSMEAINTSIEGVLDVVHPERHDTIRKIKDISAGAVLIAAMMSLIIGLNIYLPKLCTT